MGYRATLKHDIVPKTRSANMGHLVGPRPGSVDPVRSGTNVVIIEIWGDADCLPPASSGEHVLCQWGWEEWAPGRFGYMHEGWIPRSSLSVDAAD